MMTATYVFIVIKFMHFAISVLYFGIFHFKIFVVIFFWST